MIYLGSPLKSQKNIIWLIQTQIITIETCIYIIFIVKSKERVLKKTQ